MFNFRDVISVLVLIGLTGVSVAAGVQVYRQGLRNPQAADRAELRAWLSERDLRVQPREVKLELAQRLEADFRRGIDWHSEVASLDDDGWARFEVNFAELMRVWLFSKVDIYRTLPEIERPAFLDREVANIFRWQIIDRGLATINGTDASDMRSRSLVEFLMESIPDWIRHAEPEQRVVIFEFLNELRARVVRRALTPLQPGVSPHVEETYHDLGPRPIGDDQ